MAKNIYNENVYLSNDSSAMMYFGEKREKNLRKQVDQRIKYIKIIEEYNRFLLVLRNFMKTLGLNSEIENAIALAWLERNGYLSFNKNITNGQEAKNEILGRYGMSILGGYCVCRNISEMAYDVLRLLDYYVKQLYVYQPNLSLPTSARLKQANHVINLIEHEGVNYGIDLCNGCGLYRFKNKLTLEKITQEIGGKLRYKPYYEFIVGQSTQEEIGKQLKQFEIDSKKRTIAPVEYELGIYPDTIQFMNAHKDMCEDFHIETNETKGNIVRSLHL